MGGLHAMQGDAWQRRQQCWRRFCRCIHDQGMRGTSARSAGTGHFPPLFLGPKEIVLSNMNDNLCSLDGKKITL